MPSRLEEGYTFFFLVSGEYNKELLLLDDIVVH